MSTPLTLSTLLGCVLRKALNELKPLAPLGLRSRALPVDDELKSCVEAAATVEGWRVIIGTTSNEPLDPLPAHVSVLPPSQAAALATALRNNREERAPLVYLSGVPCSGEAGLRELYELTSQRLARGVAEALNLNILSELARSSSRQVRDRLALADTLQLWGYSRQVETLGGDEAAELRSLPHLELIPMRLDPEERDKGHMGWAQAWDKLLGARLIKNAKEARETLEKYLQEHPESEATLELAIIKKIDVPREHLIKPIKWFIRQAKVTYKLASGSTLAEGELKDLSIQLISALRRGERVVNWLLDEADNVTRSRHSTEAEELSHLGAVSAYDPEKGTLTLPIGADDVTLRSTTRSGRAVSLWAQLTDPESVRRLSCLRVSPLGLFMGDVSPDALSVTLEVPLKTSHTQRLSSEVQALLNAREALLTKAALELTRLASSEGETPLEGLVATLRFAAQFPLTFSTLCQEECALYCEAYCDLLNAAEALGRSELMGEEIELICNMDVMYAREGTSAELALLSPLHPLRVARHLAWVTSASPTPQLPTCLTFNGSANVLGMDTLIYQGGDLYKRGQLASPTPKALEEAIIGALRKAYTLLNQRSLGDVIHVELIDFPSVTDAVNATTIAALERYNSTDGGDLSHIDLSFSYQELEQPKGKLRLSSMLLSDEANRLLETPPGEGPSLRVDLNAQPHNLGRFKTVKVIASHARFNPLTVSLARPTGDLKLRYQVTGSGQVSSVDLVGVRAWDALRSFLEGINERSSVQLGQPNDQAEELGALVSAYVGRNAWPVNPHSHPGLLSYSVSGDHVHVIALSEVRLTNLLKRRLNTLSAARVPQVDALALTRAVTKLYDARELLISLLDESFDMRAIKGHLGKVKAYHALIGASSGVKRLVLNLDCQEGHEWARCAAAKLNAPARRADLLVIEANEELTELRRLKVIELKSYEQQPSLSTELCEQPVEVSRRLKMAFSGELDRASTEALRALWWLDASRQREASRWRELLNELDAHLEANSSPQISAELWVTVGVGAGQTLQRVAPPAELTGELEVTLVLSEPTSSELLCSALGAQETTLEVTEINESQQLPTKPDKPLSFNEVRRADLRDVDNSVPQTIVNPQPRARRGLLDLESLYDEALTTLRELKLDASKPDEPHQEGPGFYVLRFKPGRAMVKKIQSDQTAQELKLSLKLTQDQDLRSYIDRGVVVFEVPKGDKDRYFIDVDELLARDETPTDELCVPFGEDISGELVWLNLSSDDSPHLLIGGTTGSGKSVALEAILYALCARRRPQELELALIDPKGTELTAFDSSPQLLGERGITPTEAIKALEAGVEEMERRAGLFQSLRVKKLQEYNARLAPNERLPWRVIVLDEYADLTSDPDDKRSIEALLQRLAQKGRSAGLHLIVATQKPTTTVLNTVTRSNFPAQLALRVKTAQDSRVIMDEGGAESLAGKGDAFFKTARGVVRVQCAAVNRPNDV